MQIVVDGVLTNYEIIGNKPKTLIILHGWMRSLNEWLPIAKELSNHYQVILLDLPGFGKTVLPQTDYSIYEYADFVERFLDKLGIHKVSLLGHSFGGRIGIILAAKRNRINNLILVDAAGVEELSNIAKLKIATFKSARLVVPKPYAENLRNKFGSSDYKSSGAMRNIFLKTINEDLSYLLPQIDVPTLLIWGNKDTEISESKIRKMNKLIKDSTLRIVWESGHSPHLEKPKELIEILEEYPF